MISRIFALNCYVESCFEIFRFIIVAQAKYWNCSKQKTHIEKVRAQLSCNWIKRFRAVEVRAKDKTTPLLLNLYEFEAHARLGDDARLEEILERLLSLPAAEAKAFETIAGTHTALLILYGCSR